MKPSRDCMASRIVVNERRGANKTRSQTPIIFFIDIDGTLTDGSVREHIMEQEGFVIGEYGSPDRIYPHGKQTFLEAFCNPELFETDITMPNAVEIIEAIKSALKSMEIYVFFVTARDSQHHQETEEDLRHRGLWINGARLVCKPHRKAPKTVEYKTSVFAGVVNALNPSNIVIIDNSKHILDGAIKCFSASTYRTAVNTFECCTDALNWWKSYVEHQMRSAY